MKSIMLLILFVLSINTIMQPMIFETSAIQTRKVILATFIHRLEVVGESDIRLNVDVSNLGDKEELLDLTILKPEGWEASLMSGGYVIKSIFLASNESRLINFEAYPPRGVEVGSYTFVIDAQSRDQVVKASLSIQVDILAKAVTEGISLDTSYPSIEGPSGQDYEFMVTVRNVGNKDRVIGFSVFHPQDWRVAFKPMYEEKQVRSLDFEAAESKTITVAVSPPPDVKPGNHNITVVATSEALQESLSLNVIIIGTYKLDISTPEGLLSIDAIQGEETYLTLILENTGTAPLEKAYFTSSKPSGWDVKFEPKEISSISLGSSREIRVAIKPPSDAIPGDYSVLLSSFAEPYGTSDGIELRVTVRASVTWGLVGVGIIIVAVALLLAVFWRFGRR